jgi:hypothetical protein
MTITVPIINAFICRQAMISRMCIASTHIHHMEPVVRCKFICIVWNLLTQVTCVTLLIHHEYPLGAQVVKFDHQDVIGISYGIVYEPIRMRVEFDPAYHKRVRLHPATLRCILGDCFVVVD